MSSDDASDNNVLQAGGHGELSRSAVVPGALVKQTDLAEVHMYLLMQAGAVFPLGSSPSAGRSNGEVETLLSYVPQPYFAAWGAAVGPLTTVDFADEVAVRRCCALLEPLMEQRCALGFESMSLATEVCHLHLRDELHGMAAPCIMDIKLGRQRHTPRTPHAKIAKINAKEGGKYVATAGVRITGAIVTAATCQENGSSSCFSDNRSFVVRRRLDREQFRDVDEVGFVAALRDFCGGDAAVMSMFKSQVLRFLQLLTAAHEEHLFDRFAFVSTSLLLLYDAEAMSPRATNSCFIRWIDFARSGPRRFHFSEDFVGFFQGVRTLLYALDTACIA
jgi:hypothetical protein